ncbi:MAG: zinc-binding alcohol dehydrogenase [Chloroflexota bacterium]
MQTALYFAEKHRVTIQSEPLPALADHKVLVQTLLSAISPGTEMLIYRGQFPEDLPIDENIAGLQGRFGYPLKYGYCNVGQVIETGAQVDANWRGRLVFAFQPHQSHYIADPQELLPLPEGITPEQAIFLPNMETAVNFLMDGKPLIGERVVVFGQGIIGLLTTALLVEYPLEKLITLDHYPLRRKTSLQLGAQASLPPSGPETAGQLDELLPGGADLTFELSGAPQALDEAIHLTGFDGRVIIGSWYGQKRASLALGGRFHRSRIRLISSQVSTLAPELAGRWSKARRLEVAWHRLRQIQPEHFITHRFGLPQASQAYQLIDQHPEETIQVVLTYS